MIPITIESDITIPVAFLSSQINVMIVDYIPFIATYFMIISVNGSALAITVKLNFIFKNNFLRTLLNVKYIYAMVYYPYNRNCIRLMFIK
ncbi:hypothetical protein ABET41_19260 [Metabacillus fastidiosus]|uniref:Uncharacterized protein n=1 Tax=Metabacillus fastidiosus TaxID=1458 RepID=A0ABU6NTH3_9BACI|nr:hypothetical protein [Metabacillus fastidiosus]MED4400448.1 hypothetical protein [Metabacillus fastidiosus]MED4464332.1 hypothetical protein [Metabacillus fastidiosus]